MERNEQTTISVIWHMNRDKEVANPNDEIFDAQGRRWIVSYFPTDDGTTECTLEEALEIARSSPTGDYQVYCDIPHDCSTTLRQLIGHFYDAHRVEFCLSYFEESVHKTTFSLTGIEQFQRLEKLKMHSSGMKRLCHQVDLLIDEIDFCANLKHLTIQGVTIPSLGLLVNLELESFEVTYSSVNDLSMVRSKKFVIDPDMLPLMREKLKIPCIVQAIHVANCVRQWDMLIEMEDLQTELRNQMCIRPGTAVVTRSDLISSLERGHVSVIGRDAGERTSIDNFRARGSEKSVHIVVCRGYLKGGNSKKPVADGGASPKLLGVLNRLSTPSSNTSQLTIRELKTLCQHLQIDIRHIFSPRLFSSRLY